MKFLTVILAGALLLTLGTDADAQRRMGGGKSIGKQSSNVTQREAAPQAPAAPAQSANNAVPSKAAAAPNAAAAQPKRPWGAMLGGLAAGLGLAWLASSLGLGEAFGQFLLIALLVLVAMVVIGAVMRARRGAQPQQANRSPFAFQGAGGGSPQEPQMPRSYRPENVGNDASARPFERNATAFDAGPAGVGNSGIVIGSGLSGAQTWGVPGDFDTDGFLTAAKRNFVTLQSAWDRADISSLRAMMTDAMLGEIQAQLKEREAHTGGQSNTTEVVMLDAKLLGIEDTGEDYMASVEFSGMIREEPSAGPSPFREVWNMTKPKSGHAGWLVAGVQALQ
ncbi:Tim44 domain-containing protein [Pseudorhodoferax sp. Leaf265]|jgi:predicted lipid-binding transport protein (Tim44 family)|uniref:Tim44 domain-containing protein n=1 Tax=Pseudorhodoferax sp. Leaf265 TaxID=1736315 RepID=UPI0006F8D95C|nr:Tim44-like domain-containing protein [Pseudorhodoferax sp. Leaf265]KQP21143.1 preprotein translocase subunit Tim44 [Pseudorhodoferax sp. Leaf265]PZP95730.1 MAG: Tim44 domain-containing protein [Variovorax paradoxus]PZQ06684.1 MAG: Tim44 domain-containing protein [Variovorax paradoxus]